MLNMPAFTASRNAFLQNVSSGLTFLLRDTFGGTESAPLASPHTCDIIGTLELVQTGGQLSITGGELIVPVTTDNTGAGLCWADIGRTRANGLAHLSRLQAAIAGATSIYSGWFNSATLSTTSIYHVMRFDAGSVLRIGSVTGLNSVTATANNTYYWLASILTSWGCLHYAKFGSTWELVGIDMNKTTTPVYAGGMQVATTAGRTGKGDSMRVLQMGAPFITDYGSADFTSAFPVAGTSGTISADSHTFVKLDGSNSAYVKAVGDTLSVFSVSSTGTIVQRNTYASASFQNTATGMKVITSDANTVDLAIRWTDDNNCWICRFDTVGNTFKLIEKVAGTEAERATGSVAIGVFALTNLVSYSQTPSGNALVELERVIA